VAHIFGLALAAAASLSIQLLAVVLVIVTRPRPRPLLWAFWLSLMVVSCAFGYGILAIFRAKGTILGTTSRSVNPSIYLIVGVIALGVAIFAATKRGRELIGREIERGTSDAQSTDGDGLGDRIRARAQGVKTRAEEALKRGSVWVAIAAGFVLGAPTPFGMAAIGTMVRNDYRLPTQLLLILGFNLVTYLLVVLPIISYAVWPDSTGARVEAFSTWLGTNKIQAAAIVAAIVGVAFIVKGLVSL